MSRRILDWKNKLYEVVRSYDGKPFVWGSTDCGCFARDAVRAISGENIMQFGFDGAYSSRLVMRTILVRRGFQSVSDALGHAAEQIGFPEIEPRFSIEGDIGVSADDVCLVRLHSGFVARADDGKFYHAAAVRAWRID